MAIFNSYFDITRGYLHIAPGGDDAIHGAQWSPLAVALPRRGIAQGGCGEAQLPGRPAWSHRRLVDHGKSTIFPEVDQL